MLRTQNHCPRCESGPLSQSSKDEKSCLSCGYVAYESAQDVKGPILDRWERDAILAALTEVYLRTKGNIRRSQLPLTREINEERAAQLLKLLEKVRRL